MMRLLSTYFQELLKIRFIGNFLYVMVMLLISAWSILFIGYRIGGLVHILPVLAIGLVYLRFRLDSRAIIN